MKVGFIGCGRIAQFHADVLQHLGVEIAAVSYRTNLENARAFQVRNNIPKIFQDWRAMVDNAKPDALWVLSDWKSIDQLLIPVLATSLPVFFEKPVALTSSKIKEAMSSFPESLTKVQVGYNRRFYRIAGKLKEELAGRSIINIELTIPESVDLSDQDLIANRPVQNSSHLMDLLIWLLDGEVPAKINVHQFRAHRKLTPGFTAQLETSSGIPVYISSVYNSATNSAVRIYTDDEYLFELKPLEKLSIYKGFEVSEPSARQPIRLYNPKVISEDYEVADKFKPGFLGQAEAFIKDTMCGNNTLQPNLESSLAVTMMIESIIQ